MTEPLCLKFLPPANEVCEGYVFTGGCLFMEGMHGGHVWWGFACQGACVAGGMHGRGVYLAGGMCFRGHVCQGACVSGGHTWQEGVCGRGHAWQEGVHGRGISMAGGCVWQGGCIAGGMYGRGCEWQERRPLQQAVHILLECILVVHNFEMYYIYRAS